VAIRLGQRLLSLIAHDGALGELVRTLSAFAAERCCRSPCHDHDTAVGDHTVANLQHREIPAASSASVWWQQNDEIEDREHERDRIS
jgi:hypothetical protein